MRWGTLLAAASVAVVPSLAAQGMAIGEADSVLHALVETYGASGAEGPVRDLVKQLLPRGVVTRTDTAGNLLVQFGRGKPLTVFIAHMDEIGWRVSSINDDGTVAITNLGGFFSSFYEGRPALIHTGAADGRFRFISCRTDSSNTSLKNGLLRSGTAKVMGVVLGMK